MNEPPSESAARRRINLRWVTLAEAVAVAGVLIAALTLLNSWFERRDAAAERAAEQHSSAEQEQAARTHVSLTTTDVDSHGIGFRAQEGCALQSSEIRFPTPLAVPPEATVVSHRIEAAWIARPILDLIADGPAQREGRVPVLIDATCAAADGDHHQVAVYDLMWRSQGGGLFGGRSLKLRGIVRHAGGGADQKAIDAEWRRLQPVISSAAKK